MSENHPIERGRETVLVQVLQGLGSEDEVCPIDIWNGDDVHDDDRHIDSHPADLCQQQPAPMQARIWGSGWAGAHLGNAF